MRVADIHEAALDRAAPSRDPVAALRRWPPNRRDLVGQRLRVSAGGARVDAQEQEGAHRVAHRVSICPDLDRRGMAAVGWVELPVRVVATGGSRRCPGAGDRSYRAEYGRHRDDSVRAFLSCAPVAVPDHCDGVQPRAGGAGVPLPGALASGSGSGLERTPLGPRACAHHDLPGSATEYPATVLRHRLEQRRQVWGGRDGLSPARPGTVTRTYPVRGRCGGSADRTPGAWGVPRRWRPVR